MYFHQETEVEAGRVSHPYVLLENEVPAILASYGPYMERIPHSCLVRL